MFWLIFLIGGAARIGVGLLPPFSATQYEEAVVGLMARHILHGDPIVLWWAQPYEGTFELYLMAGLFWLFGSSTLILRIVPFVVSLCGLSAVYFLGRTLFNRKIALLAMLFLAVPPVFLLAHSLIPYTAYLSFIALGALVMLWTYNVLFRRRFLRRLNWHYLGIGFVCGFLLWQHLLSISFSLTTFLLLVACQRRFLRSAGFWILAGGFILGASPLILWNFLHHFDTYAAMVGGKGAAHFLSRVKYLFDSTLPEVLGMGKWPLWEKILFWVAYAPFAVLMLGLGGRALKNLLRRGKGDWEGATFLWFYFIMPIFLFILFKYHEPRYVFPVFASAPLLLATFVSRWEKKSGWIAPILMLALVGFNGVGVAHFANEVKHHPRREIDSVIAFLKEEGTPHVFCHNRVALPLCFESREEIRASDFISYTDNRFYIRKFDFYMKPFFEEGRAVAKADKVAFVTHEWLKLPVASQLENWLRSLRVRYKIKRFGVYTVFYDLAPDYPPLLKSVDPGRFHLKSSVFPDRLSDMIDRNLSTSWRSLSQKDRCDYIEIEFNEPTPLVKISLLSGNEALKKPENLIAEVSQDGRNWKTAVDLSEGTISMDWFGHFPRMEIDSNMHLYFSGEKVKFVRLSTARSYSDWWSIAEMLVYEADSNHPPSENWKNPKELQELARSLKEEGVKAVYGPDPLLLALQDFLPKEIQSYNFFERRNEPITRGSSRVDFSLSCAFIVQGEEAKSLREDLARIGVGCRLLRRFNEEEVWVAESKSYIPQMVWKKQRLFDFYSRSESQKFLAEGEREWDLRHAGLAKICFLASMKKTPNAAAYDRLKECYRQLGDREGLKELESRWKNFFEPAIPRLEIFGGRIKLLGVTLPEKKVFSPGEAVRVNCLWEFLKPIDRPLAFFVHALDSNGKVAFQADHNVGEVWGSDGIWMAGEKVNDPFDIMIPPKVKPGYYEIDVGWWDPHGSKKRLPVVDGKGKVKKNRVKIGELVCESGKY